MIVEAQCQKCGETFVPQPSTSVQDSILFETADLEHGEREDGTSCGGKGEVTGVYGGSAREIFEYVSKVKVEGKGWFEH